MKLGDFLNSLAIKAGINPAEKALVDFLSRQDIANIDVSNELASSIDANLMTLDGAKNNPTIKSHFFASALNGIDTEILNALPEFGFGDDIITEFKNEKNTNGKLRNLVTKLKEAQKNHAAADNSVDKKKYAEEITALNGKISKLSDDHKAEINSIKNQHAQEIKDMLLTNMLVGKNYANKELPAEVNSTVARTLVNNALQTKGAKLINVNGKLMLKRSDDESLEYMENHKPITPESFIDSVLADNKLLAVSGHATPKTPVTPDKKTVPSGSNFGQQIDQLNETINQFNEQ